MLSEPAGRKPMDPLCETPHAEPGAVGRQIQDWLDAHRAGARTEPLSTLRHAMQLIARAGFPMFIVWGPERLLYYNDAYAVLLDYRHPAAFGRSFFDAAPETRQFSEPLLDAAFAGQKAFFEDFEVTFQQQGRPRTAHYTFSYSPLCTNEGEIPGVLCVCVETTERAAREAREHLLSMALDAARMGVWIVDALTLEVKSSPELNEIFGLAPDARPTLEELNAQYEPEDLVRAQLGLLTAMARSDRYYEYEARLVRKRDSAARWLLVRAKLEVSASGLLERMIGVAMDITERKEAEERLKLLAREVDHRANNLLAVVQSTVRLTKAPDVATYREALNGRLEALAHAHKLLAESRWVGASVRKLVEEELRPFERKQVRISGPDASLGPPVAQALAMALHELATNAAKYGALSVQDGVVDVSWGPPDADGLIELCWIEAGGPPVTPPRGLGVGTMVLQRALSGSLGGASEIDWRRDGLRCRLRFPVQ
jgi:PAS domain S-box-containing protein